MDVYNLSERITIQEKVKSKKDNGEVISSWDDKFTIWANVIPMRADESYAGDKKTFSQRFKFRVRYRSDIGVEDRIQFDGRTFDIKSTNKIYKDGNNKITEIVAEYNG